MAKKAFDLARNSIYVADPATDLALIGGITANLPAEQQGDADTGDGPDHDLWDPRLLDVISEEFIASIDAFGVLEPILIAKIDDMAVVVDGRQRVRAARVVNLRRKARGEPAIKVEAKVVRRPGLGLMGAMVTANEARRDDNLLAKIEKLKRYMSRGVSVEDASIAFAISVPTAKGWLAFDDNATDALKDAAARGTVSVTAAAEIARVKDPEKQVAALRTLEATPGKKTVVAARRAVATSTKDDTKGDGVGLIGRRDQRAFLDKVVEVGAASGGKAHHDGSAEYWEGVEATLKAVLGEGKLDARIRKLLKTI